MYLLHKFLLPLQQQYLRIFCSKNSHLGLKLNFCSIILMMYDLTKILPHKPPMILLDDIVGIDIKNSTLTSLFRIYPGKIFYEKSKGVSSLAGIEFMAQTIGCYTYFKNKCKEPQPGLLLGTRLYNNKIEYFKEGEEYTVMVKEVFTDNNIAAFDCLIYDNSGDEIASAGINVGLKG